MNVSDFPDDCLYNPPPLLLSSICHIIYAHYTLSHPENDRGVIERTKGYTLQDTLFMRQSQDSILNAWENTHMLHGIISIFLWNTRWRHGRSQGETKYSTSLAITSIIDDAEMYYVASKSHVGIWQTWLNQAMCKPLPSFSLQSHVGRANLVKSSHTQARTITFFK